MSSVKPVKRHPAKTTVFVPNYAMSGGALIALAANEIVMDPRFSVPSILSLATLRPPRYFGRPVQERTKSGH